MKKITAIALALLMVISMIPAMALMSSATENFTSGTYGNGAETWRQQAKDDSGTVLAEYHHTQFLVYVPNSIWDTVKKSVGYTATKYDTETSAWVQGGITSGKFVLSITDLSGTTTDVTCPPTTVGAIGENAILRFETGDHGTPAYQIQLNNSYKITLSIYLDASSSTPDYVGSSITASWAAGKAEEGCDKMYNDNKALETTPTYTGEVKDPYETPVEVNWVTYNNIWFENHTTWGKVMMAGFLTDKIPNGGNVGSNEIKTAAKAVVTWPDGTKKETTFAEGNESFTMDYSKDETIGGPVTLFRLVYDPLPDIANDDGIKEGESMEGVKIEFIRKSDNKVMFTGTVGKTAPAPDKKPAVEFDASKYKTPIKTNLSRYMGEGKSDWETQKDGTLTLLVNVDGMITDSEFKYEGVKVTATFDGKEISGDNVLHSVYDFGKQEDGTYKHILRLNVGTPTAGEHTIELKVLCGDTVMYESAAPLTVTYNAETTGSNDNDVVKPGSNGNSGDKKPSGNNSGSNTNTNTNNNNGNKNPSNSNSGSTSKTGDGVVYATIAMAVVLVAMVVVAKKSRA